jgi:hypothetical protein
MLMPQLATDSHGGESLFRTPLPPLYFYLPVYTIAYNGSFQHLDPAAAIWYTRYRWMTIHIDSDRQGGHDGESYRL